MPESWDHMVERAVNCAVRAHYGQRDKQGRPAILHVMRVATDAGLPNDRARVLAALHDVVEDTGWRVDDFPADIRSGVDVLTRRGSETYAAYIERVAESGDEDAVQVKIADLRHNLERGGGDPRFTSLCDRYVKALERLDPTRDRMSEPAGAQA